MTSRSIRRATERKAQKELRREELHKVQPGPQNENVAISAPQLAANRANAQLSTGPRSEEGKRTSSLNGITTGLTGVTVLLPSDDAALYQRLIRRFLADHKPVGERECELVQSLANAQWRMNRIPGLEMALFSLGRIQFAEQYAAYDDQTAAALSDAQTIVFFQKQLRNLGTQEGRLRRQYQNDLAELRELQVVRAEQTPEQSQPANGFEF
jgi:hypothetical protein